MSVFNEYGQYYNLLYKDKDYPAESSYIISLLKDYAPNCKDILELGCGTGKHAKILSQAGYTVLGVDISQTMLAEAQSIKNDQLTFICDDVRSFACAKTFCAVISLFHIASYQTSNEDIIKYLKTAKKHLSKDGIFLFDFWYAPAVLHLGAENRTKIMEDDFLKIERKAKPEHFPNENKINVHYEVSIYNKQSKERHTLNEVHSMRYFSLPEIEYMLNQVGFKLLHSEEWFTKKQANFDTWGVLCVAQKKE